MRLTSNAHGLPGLLTRVAAVVVLVACATNALSEDDEKAAPTVDEVLAKIDAVVFFPDSQPGLTTYTCDVTSTRTATQVDGTMQPERKGAEAVAKAAVDAKAGTKTWTDPGKKSVEPGTWAPSAGPWTISSVARFQVELFASPLAKRFTDEAWKRSVSAEGDGWRLVLTPKKPLGPEEPFFMKPVLTRVELVVGKDGLPTKGTMGLDQGPMKEDGTFECEFEAAGELHRIAKIRSHLTSANMGIKPVLEFAYAEQKDFVLLDRVVCRIPMGNLSPTMGRTVGGDMVSGLFFDGYEVKGKKPKDKKPTGRKKGK